MFPLVMLIKYLKKNLGYKPSYGVVLLILPAWEKRQTTVSQTENTRESHATNT